MKKISTFILFVLLTTIAFAQHKYQDDIYLKNGSETYGMAMKQVSNKTGKIETANKNIFVYQMDTVQKIVKEKQKDKTYPSTPSKSQKGFKGIVETGYGIGVGDKGMSRANLNVIGSYQFNSHFSLGVGTGLRYYTQTESVLIPFFADFRGYFMNNRKVSPYTSLDIGYSFDATNNFSGAGLLVNPNVGVYYKISDKLILNAGVGYEMQGMESGEYGGGEENSSNEENGNNFSGAINLNVGISFSLNKNNK